VNHLCESFVAELPFLRFALRCLRPLSALPLNADASLRSRVFPGVWLHPGALVARDGAALLAKLQEGLQSPEHASFVRELKKHAVGA
jgi:hypothetical protein